MANTPQLLSHIKDLSTKFDPKALTDEVVKLGEDWADKDASANTLEETKKSILAKKILEIVDANKQDGKRGISISQAEYLALADEDYKLHLELMVSARASANKARVRYDMGKMQLELIRSLQATLRTELKGF